MRIAIMGSGGVGCYFGGLLARAGEDVTFIARGEHLRAMQSNGLRVESVHGDFDLPSVQATADPGSVGPVDLVLFATKTYQMESASQALLPLVGPDTVVLPVQNGVEAADVVTRYVPRERVVGGACWVVSEVVAPAHVKQLSQFRRIVLGELDGGTSSRCERIAETIRNAGAVSEATSDIRKILWTKFLFIASYSGLGAVTRVPAGELNAVPEVRQTLELAMREVEALAAARGVQLAPDVVPVTMEFVANVAPDATSSMQRDIMAGRPSELEAHNGYLARLAAERGIPAPVHSFIYSVLLPQDRAARRRAGLPV